MDDLRFLGTFDTGRIPQDKGVHPTDGDWALMREGLGKPWRVRAWTQSGHDYTEVPLVNVLAWAAANEPDMLQDALRLYSPTPAG